MSHQPHTAPAYNPDDPHHEHERDHGHTIVSWKILVAVLAVLLTFTALTVSAANAEKWIAASFDIILPQWVNVAVAMSIATIKGILVMMFFMQLRYDNPFNTILMLFCFLAFSLFLGFTALDINNRAMVDPWKVAQVSAGGMGMNGTPLVWQARINVAQRRNWALRGMDSRGDNYDATQEADWRQRLGNERYDAELLELSYILDRPGIEAYIAEHGLDHYFERVAYYDPRAAGHHVSHTPAASTGSSSQRSRPRTGLSGALDTTPAQGDHAHEAGATGEHAEESHAVPDAGAGSAPDAGHAPETHPSPAPAAPTPAGETPAQPHEPG